MLKNMSNNELMQVNGGGLMEHIEKFVEAVLLAVAAIIVVRDNMDKKEEEKKPES